MQMIETNNLFEQEMQLGVAAHMHGDYSTALAHRFAAFSGSSRSIEAGRAARDIAASFDRLGGSQRIEPDSYPYVASNSILANAYAEYAYREHKAAMVDVDRAVADEASREFTVSAMYAAIRAARSNKGADALEYIREGWNASSVLWIRNGKPHQYDVNIAGRVAGIEAVYGEKPTPLLTRKAGNKALKLAMYSEDPKKILGANESLDAKQIRRAKGKALIRGLAAQAIIGLEMLPTRSLTEPAAKKFLQKIVL